MKLPAFKIERYFARYEFKTEFLLCPSDCESFSLSELLQMADTESLSLWKNLRLGYTESLGHPLLREEIAALYTGLSKEDVLQTGSIIMAGTSEDLLNSADIRNAYLGAGRKKGLL
jgi:hypothetical protein